MLLREVLERVGPLDERYETGNPGDFDLCVRARLAGYRPLLALDVFVHHFGGRTFAERPLDHDRRLPENLLRLRAKWAGNPAAAEWMADPPPVEADGPLLATSRGRAVAPALAAFEEGARRLHGGDPVGAEACFVQALAGIGGGVLPASARHNLGAAYLRQGREAEAEGQWRRALLERPEMPATLQELGRLAARRGRWGEVAERAAVLERAGAVAEAVELRRQVPGIRSEREPG